LANEKATQTDNNLLDTPRKVNLKRKLSGMSQRCETAQKRIKLLQQTKRRLKSKVANLKDIIGELHI